MEPPHVKRLRSRVRNLERKLAESIPKAEADAIRTDLEARVRRLQEELSKFVPRDELDEAKAQLEARIRELEKRLADSVPRRQVESLERRIGDAESELAAAKARVRKMWLGIGLVMLVLLFSLTYSGYTRRGYVFGIRLDDVQDYWPPQGTIAFLEKMIEKDVKVTVAVIANGFGSDHDLLNLVRQGVEKGLFDVAVHGWDHEDFSTLDYGSQVRLLHDAKEKLEELFPGVKISTFVPPYNAMNIDTLEAAAENNLECISGAVDPANPNPHDPTLPIGWSMKSEGKVIFRPSTVDTAWAEGPDWYWQQADLRFIKARVKTSMDLVGYAMFLLHPQQFFEGDSNVRESWRQDRFDAIMNLIDWAKENGKIVQLEDLNKDAESIPAAKGLESVVTKSTEEARFDLPYPVGP